MTIQKENHDKFHRQQADSFYPKTGYNFSAPLRGFFPGQRIKCTLEVQHFPSNPGTTLQSKSVAFYGLVTCESVQMKIISQKGQRLCKQLITCLQTHQTAMSFSAVVVHHKGCHHPQALTIFPTTSYQCDAMKLLTPPHPSMQPERVHSIPNSTQQNFSKQTPALVYVVCFNSGKKS